MVLFLSDPGRASGYFNRTADFIVSNQADDGAIAWSEAGTVDPWDHIEAAMGLSIAGYTQAAERAYLWLRETQLHDGSWWSYCCEGSFEHTRGRESNSAAYLATGVWHHYLITRDRAFLMAMWPTVEAAVEFALALQMPGGAIHWARDRQGRVVPGALLAGCSSICKSLECALEIASALDEPRPHWHHARCRLEDTIRCWSGSIPAASQDERHFAMDWFYPVLCGAITGVEAQMHLRARWDTFVQAGLGCRCVAEKSWMSVAESCELTLALLAAGEIRQAAILFNWMHQFRDADGGYWTGYTSDNQQVWPAQKTTWTAGVVLMAADALTGYTPAARLFARPPRDFTIGSPGTPGSEAPLPLHLAG